jgi:hypothetical protein
MRYTACQTIHHVKRVAAGLAIGCVAGCAPAPPDVVPPDLLPNLVVYYDFEHPVRGAPDREVDRGTSNTVLHLINGGADMRVDDGAHVGSTRSLQTQQVNPGVRGKDDWKAGTYDETGVGTMAAFASVSGITLMGWIKPTGANPALNSNSPEPDDRFGAVGLFGLLSGDSDGHAVRALVEVIDVSGTPRLVALGRRIDGASSLVLAANEDWRTLLPAGTWTHLAATFDFDNGTMALYRNGEPLASTYTSDADAWATEGPPEPDVTSPTAPAGIKIGGSFPQNTGERNPFTGRLDDLMFFDRALTVDEVRRQFVRFETGG